MDMKRWVMVPVLMLVACVGNEPVGVGGGGGPEPGPKGGITLDSAELRVVFVGNSLTYTHDVPALVQAMADQAGESMAHAMVADPNFSLEEHWYNGVPELLRELRADVVVLQQGPSSLQENQAHLRDWTLRFDTVIRESGGTSALYMVWPSAQRSFAFPDVWTSYQNAANAVNGAFIPAGQTWVEAWKIDPNLPLYGPDQFHPSYLGALAAAQTIYAVLFDVPAGGVPELTDEADTEIEAVLREGLAESLRLAGYGGE